MGSTGGRSMAKKGSNPVMKAKKLKNDSAGVILAQYYRKAVSRLPLRHSLPNNSPPGTELVQALPELEMKE